MSARETMLSQIRAALKVMPEIPADEPIICALDAVVDIVALMEDRLEDYRAIVVLAEGDVPAAIGHALRLRGINLAVIDPALDSMLRPEGVTLIEDHGLTARELDAIPAAITTASVAIAETGTILLTHGAGQGRRAISLVPDVHICVLRRDQIVGTVPEAMAVIGTPQISTWISGPSATSDIELSRVEGVHGPRTLIVILD